MNTEYDIGIVIVTWNGKHHLERLVPSLLAQDTDKKYKIVIVDNASIDGTKEFLENYKEIDYIQLFQNQGFAEPNNIGIRHLFKNYVSIEKVIFLNNDTIVPKTFISTLLSGFAENSKIGSVQTKIVSMDSPHIIDSVGITIDRSMSAINRGQGEIDHGQYEKREEIFGTTGSAMMVSRGALETVDLGNGNYFDSLYFAYQEDVDMAVRMRLCGFVSFYIPGEPVLHVHSAAGKAYSSFKSFHIQRNTIFTIIKIFSFFQIFYSLFLFCKRYLSHVESVKKGTGPASELSKKISLCGMVFIVFRVWASMFWYLPRILVHRYFVRRKCVITDSKITSWFARFPADTHKMLYGKRS